MEFKGELMRSFSLFFIFSLCFASTIFGALPDENGNKRATKTDYKVLILGAGMAGIAAAKTLWDTQTYRDFLVLEANNRVGGRLLKYAIDGANMVELGANWVHGTDNNPIWKLVQKAELNYYNTINDLILGKYLVLNETGDDVSAEDGHEHLEKVQECVEDLEKEKKLTMKKQTMERSKRELLRICGWNPQKPAEKAIEYNAYDFDAAVPPERISCGIKLNTDAPIDSEGGTQALVNDERGYAKIIEDMAEPFSEKIMKGYKVTKIIKNKDDTKITVEVKHGIEFSQSTQFTAEHVLVTFSIGVLQEYMDTMFDPPLSPLPFGVALGKMEMANYLKIFMKFNKKFWLPIMDYTFYAPNDDAERRWFPVWQNLPGKTSYTNKLYASDNDNVLLVTRTGDEAWESKEERKVPIGDAVFDILKKVYKKNIDPDVKLLKTQFKNWGEDPLFLGAYSNAGVCMTSSDFAILTSPVKEFGNRLYFAGEGTSELYYGFLQGAYLTGEAQAEKIIDVLKLQPPNIQHRNMETGWRVLRRNLGTTRNGITH